MEKVHKAKLAAHVFFKTTSRFEVLDYDYHGYTVVIDHDDDAICFVNIVMLDRPMYGSLEGQITKHEFEDLIDMYLDDYDDVSMFIRFDIMHVFIGNNDHGIARYHVNVPLLDDEKGE